MTLSLPIAPSKPERKPSIPGILGTICHVGRKRPGVSGSREDFWPGVLGRDHSFDAGHRQIAGYCREMICADFLAGASLDGNNPEILLRSVSRYYKFLPSPQQEAFLSEVNAKAS